MNKTEGPQVGCLPLLVLAVGVMLIFLVLKVAR
jgi:hypothetical protein